MVTLGIYRFWLTTDVRRFLWANTEVAGESLEYTGTPLELLLGFLIAIAILIPVYAGFFVAAFFFVLVVMFTLCTSGGVTQRSIFNPHVSSVRR